MKSKYTPLKVPTGTHIYQHTDLRKPDSSTTSSKVKTGPAPVDGFVMRFTLRGLLDKERASSLTFLAVAASTAH